MFLGYKKGADGKPEIVEDEAKIIREIYDKYLEGDSIRKIADYLNDNQIKTPTGKNVWYPTEVSDSGNVTDARELHPEKTELSRAVIELGIITDVNPVQFEKARVPICVIVPGKYMEVSLEQLRKASSPMDSSVLGMAMTAKLEQLKKAWSPIDVSKFGKCREINPVQL